MDPAVGQPVRRADVIPLQVSAHDRTYRPRAVMPERSVEEVLGRGQLRPDRGGPDRRDGARRGLAAAFAVTSASAAGCAWPPAARWASRRCAWPRRRPVDWPTSTSPGPADDVHRLRCVHGGLPDRAPSTSTTATAMRRTVITGTVVQRAAAADLQSMRRAHDRRLPIGRTSATGCPPHMAALLDRELCSVVCPSAGRPPPRGEPSTSRSSRDPRGTHSEPADPGRDTEGESHEGSHGPAAGRGLGPLRGRPRAGREHRVDPGRGGGGGHLRHGRRDRVRRVRLGAAGAGAPDPGPRVAGPGRSTPGRTAA